MKDFEWSGRWGLMVEDGGGGPMLRRPPFPKHVSPQIQSWCALADGIYFSGRDLPSSKDRIRDIFGGVEALIVNLNAGMPSVAFRIKDAVPEIRIFLMQESGIEAAEGWNPWDLRTNYADAVSACEAYLTLGYSGRDWIEGWSGKKAHWLGVPGPIATHPNPDGWPRRDLGDALPDPPIVSIGIWPHTGRGAIFNIMLALRAIPDCRVRVPISNEREHKDILRIVKTYGEDPDRVMPHGLLGFAEFIQVYRDSSALLQMDLGTAWGRTAVDLASLGVPVIASNRLGFGQLLDESPQKCARSFDPISEIEEAGEALLYSIGRDYKKWRDASIWVADQRLSADACLKRLSGILGSPSEEAPKQKPAVRKPSKMAAAHAAAVARAKRHER